MVLTTNAANLTSKSGNDGLTGGFANERLPRAGNATWGASCPLTSTTRSVIWSSFCSHDTDQKTPIYLADPHFDTQLPSDTRKHVNLRKIYLDIFAITAGTPLRILYARKKPAQGEPPPWWTTCPEQITAHVRVRSFRSQDGRTDGFHDRFLITPRRETHHQSTRFNGWHNHGVTFVSLPYDVYRAEAERLWSMDVGSPTADLLVSEIGQ